MCAARQPTPDATYGTGKLVVQPAPGGAWRRRALLCAAGALGFVALGAAPTPAVLLASTTTTTCGNFDEVFDACATTGGEPALAGMDVMSYFGDGAPTAGARSLRYRDDATGATFYFSSEAARSRFAEDPESFKPQAGGYCALALSGLDPNLGDGSSCSSISPVDPSVYVVNDLGLFLFRMEGAKDIMESYDAQGLEPYAAAVAAWADLAALGAGEDAAETAPINGNDARCTKVYGATNGVKTVPGARAVRVAPR